MKKIILKTFTALSFITAVVYLISCLTPFFGADTMLIMGLLGLGFPVVLCGLLLLIFIWIFINKKVSFLLIACLLLGFKNIHAIIGIHPNQSFNLQKQSGTIRILDYNVKNFDGQLDPFDSLGSKRHQMLNYIAQQDADIICFQDFSELYNTGVASNIGYLFNNLQYRYYFVGDNYNFITQWNLAQIGIAIFSKYPLQNIQFIKYSRKNLPEGIIMADVTINNITRRIATTHLQSMWLGNKEKVIPKWYLSEDSLLNYRGKKYQKIDYYLPYHAIQAKELKAELNKSPYPVMLFMDMNEVPSSFCYHTISKDLNDVFLKKGFGWGTTYSTISPTLRIDYMLMDPSIDILQYKCDKILMSDHYPQVVDIKW